MTVLDKIKSFPLPADQYLNEDSPKTQIYVHHTASSPSPFGVLDWWKSTPERVATAFIIAGPSKTTQWSDGDIIQCFGSGKWGWHLGLKPEHLKVGGVLAKTNTELNKKSIGIEICNWGQLTYKNNKFYTYSGQEIPKAQVIEYVTPYRGFKFYQKYTQAQLDNTRELLTFLCDRWNIPKAFKGMKMFDITPEALQGQSGIWTHTSVRPDKFDCHPQPELIQMLQSV